MTLSPISQAAADAATQRQTFAAHTARDAVTTAMRLLLAGDPDGAHHVLVDGTTTAARISDRRCDPDTAVAAWADCWARQTAMRRQG